MWLCHSLGFALILLQVLTHYKVLAEGESCSKTLNNSPGACISMRQCQPYVDLLRQRGVSIGDQLRSTVCYYNGNNPIVCCPLFNTPSNNNDNFNFNNDNGNGNNNNNNNNNNFNYPQQQPQFPPQQQQFQPQQPPLTFPQQQNPNPITQVKPARKYGNGVDRETCGYTDGGHNRVVGGVEAKPGSWPWIAALGYINQKDRNKPKWLCGGTLISDRHILTAAHCVYNRKDLYLARLGEHNLYQDDDKANPVDIRIDSAHVHPQYSPSNYVNDIAVLKLKRPVAFSADIHPICLPNDDDRYKDYTGFYPFVIGWGAVFFHGPSAAALQEAQLRVVEQDKCQAVYAPFRTQVIDERVMCAALGGKDACQGDSGGPLMAPVDSIGVKFSIIGVVSFGYKCAEPGIPGVYTRVGSFLEFIYQHLN